MNQKVMLKGQDIVCLSVTLWERDSRSRYQHLMSRLAGKNRILYVEPPVSIPYAIAIPEYRRSFFRWMEGPRSLSPHVHILSLPPSMPFKGMWRVLNRLSSSWSRHVLKRSMDRLEIHDPIYYVVSPYYFDLLWGMRTKCLCYDCADEHAEVKGRSRNLILKMEYDMVRISHCVFASSERIYSRLRGISERVFLIPNGADTDHFSRALDEDSMIPTDLSVLRKPVVGFVGCFRDGVIDFELLDAIAGSTKWTLLLIGPNQLLKERRTLSRLIRKEGVRWLGFRPYEDLPYYMKGMEVCIIPYRVNRYMLGVFPLKLMEYLSAGRAVVSVDIPEVRAFEGIVYVARSKGEFIEKIEAAISEDSDERRKERIQIARDHDWSKRAKVMEEAIMRCLEGG